MACAKSYSKDAVNQLLVASEGRASPVSGETGHGLGKHVGVKGYQISDRLTGNLKSDATHPIIMDPTGKMRPESEHRDIWKSLNPGMNTKGSKSAFRENVENWVSRSGAFMDRPQAINVGKYMLNSTDGQSKLAELDGGEDRVAISMSLNGLDMMGIDAWKMYYADHDNDITHLEDFSKAFMLVDKLPTGTIHIQTFFPIK